MTEVRTTSSTGGQKGVKDQRFDLIPTGPLTELAEHYGRGAKKYAPHQWRQGYEWSKSYAAGQRHWTAFWGGEDYDMCPSDGSGCQHVTADGEPFITDSPNTCYNHTGSHHLVAAVWHGFALLEFKNTHPQHDDRFKREPEPESKPRICGHFNNFLLKTCEREPGHTDDIALYGDRQDLHRNGDSYWEDESWETAKTMR